MAKPASLLDVSDLTVRYKSNVIEITALNDVSLSLQPSEIVAIVGESGCGKSTLGLSIINLLPRPPAVVEGGEIIFEGKNLLKSESDMADMRGTSISMIFQEPMTSLDPVYTVGYQISEAIQVRERRKRSKPYGPYQRVDPSLKMGTSGGMRRVLGTQLPKSRRNVANSDEAIEALEKVQIADPEQVLDKYPHELSGGMAQRVMIAQALIEKPRILIADEPTSALDVTTQAQVLKLIQELRNEIGSSILMITHDLAVAAQVADKVAVMYCGELVELGDVGAIFEEPLHPYTEGLINSFPNKYKDEGKLTSIPGDVPRLDSPPSGCSFHPRCKYAFDRCHKEHPNLLDTKPGRKVACFLREPH